MPNRCTIALLAALLGLGTVCSPSLEAAHDNQIRECDVLIASGRYWEAIGLLQKLEAQRPTDVEVLLRLGISLSMTRNYQRAHDALNAALAAAPEDPRVLYNIGLLFLREGKRDHAIESFKKTIDLRPWHPEANFHLGVIYEERGDTEKAKQYYIAELNANGRCAKAWQHLLMLRGEDGRCKPPYATAIVIAAVGFVVGLSLLFLSKRASSKEMVCDG